jgi:anti-sigma regulatory factor (Ser/Thr protein kinase)
MYMNARLPLAANSHSVAQARRFTSQTLTRWSLGNLSDDAVLLVSELATNALLHAREPTELHLEADGRQLRVEVHDGSPLPPRARHYGLTSTTGRGLRLVDAISSAWGTEPTDTGKRVWFTLPVDGSDGEREELFVFDFDAIEPL